MTSFFQSWRFRVILIAVAVVAVSGGVTIAIVSPRLTPYFEGPEFRAMLDRQTSKGLHFEGRYEAVKRTGFSSAAASEFHADNGVKAMKSLDAWDVTAKFNPWGVLLRRWQLDSVHIKRGQVEVQTYEPKPDPKKDRPWYAIFLPDRVYLREVLCDTADVKWRLRDKMAGIFGTRVRITPHGRDFEYRANGGELRTGGMTPEMEVKALHMLITKKIFQIYQFDLAPEGGGTFSFAGKAGMKEDKSVEAEIVFDGIAVAPWLPDDLSQGVSGWASGKVVWRGDEQTIEASHGEGEVRVIDGELRDLPLTDYLAAATGRKSLEDVELDRCVVKFRWKYPEFEITSLDLGSNGKFAMEGSLQVTGGALSGALEVGLAEKYLDWLPRAKDEIFTREKDGLLWTTVRLSGTLTQPENDLAPRLAAAMKKSPVEAAGLFFRGVGEWIEQKTRGR